MVSSQITGLTLFLLFPKFVSVLLEVGIIVLENAHIRSSLPFRSFLKVTLETVPMLVWLTIALSGPHSVDHRPLPFCTSLSRRWSTLWWCSWLSSSCWRCCLTSLDTSDLPNRSSFVMVALSANRSALSFPLTPAWPEQYTQSIFWLFRLW